jgi:Arc/MetJ-type ribon-helix-helix transcriptional regulator
MKRTTIWLTPEDAAMIERLARAEGRTQADVIREAVRRLSAERRREHALDDRPAWSLQTVWFELFNDRRAGISAEETARRLGFTGEQMAEVVRVVERRFAPLPSE